MLTSSSDGIEASELRRPLTPLSSSDCQPPKRGRPKKPTRCTIEHSELFGNNEDEEEWNAYRTLPTTDLFFNRIEQFDSFFYHLQLLLQTFEGPQQWVDQGIDPYIGMMFARSKDQAYAK